MSIKFVAFRVQDPSGTPLAGATLHGERPQDQWDGMTASDPLGYFFANLELDTYTVTVNRHGFQARSLPVTLLENTGHDTPITIGLEPGSSGGNGSSGPLLPLITRGSFFALENGEPTTLIDASSFQAYHKWLVGAPTLEPHLEQLRDLGFNTIRVFLMARNLFDFNPAHYGGFYLGLPIFVKYLATFGLRANLVVFPDCALVIPELAMQQGHWHRIGAALQPVAGLCLVSLQNEADQAPNRIDTNAFSPLPGLLCSHGSNGSEQLPPRPWWAWEEMHFNSAFQWERKTGHNSKELSDGDPEGQITPSHVPVHASENTRPDNDNQIQHFEDAAAGAALLCAGSCFHAIELRTSDLLTGYALECARAWVFGAQSVSLRCQPGAYKHRSDLEGPNAGQTGERVYQRGDEDSCIVRIRP